MEHRSEAQRATKSRTAPSSCRRSARTSRTWATFWAVQRAKPGSGQADYALLVPHGAEFEYTGSLVGRLRQGRTRRSVHVGRPGQHAARWSRARIEHPAASSAAVDATITQAPRRCTCRRCASSRRCSPTAATRSTPTSGTGPARSSLATTPTASTSATATRTPAASPGRVAARGPSADLHLSH
jgi:hypothetical protein